MVRRRVGYRRLEAPALAALERVHELSRDYVNFLHPVRKLTEKVRRGARITRRYDVAQTPYRRLLASSVLPRKLEDRVTALKGTAGFYWALWQEVQHLLGPFASPGSARLALRDLVRRSTRGRAARASS